MKKTLHLKFVLAYLVFGLLAFLAVSTVSLAVTAKARTCPSAAVARII